MAYQYPLNGGRINASVGGNSTSAGAGYQLVSTGNLLLAGGNNVTLSQNANSISIAGPSLSNSNGFTFGTNGSVVTASYAGGGSVNFSAGTTSGNLNSIRLSNSNGVSFGLNGSTLTASVATNYAASNHSHGNPTLNLTNISGTTASNSAGLTLSLSAAAPSGVAVAGGGLTATSGTANLVGGGAISVNSTTGQSFVISAPAQSNLSATGAVSISNNGNTISIGAPFQTNQTIGLYATGANTTGQSSSNTLDARSFSISAQGGLYAGMSGNTLQLSAATTYAASNHSHGSPTLNLTNISGTAASASNGFTLSLNAPAQSSMSATGAFSISTNGSTISLGVPAVSMGLSNLGNTSGDTGTVSNRLVFAGGNNITLNQSTATNGATITISAGAGGGLALANSQTTYSTGTASLLEGSGAITIGSGTGQRFNISVPQASSISATGAVSISTNGNTISIGAPIQSNQAMGFYAAGNTTQSSSTQLDARSLTFNGLGGVSVGYSNGSVQISGATGGGGGGGVAIAGPTGTFTSGTVNFGANNSGAITVASTTGQQLNFSVPATSMLSAGDGISISTTGSTVVFQAAPSTGGGGAAGSIARWEYPTQAFNSIGAMVSNSLSMQHIPIPFNVTGSAARLAISMNIASLTNTGTTGSVAATLNIGLYTRSGSTLNSVASGSAATSFSYSSGNYVTSIYNGIRELTAPLAASITPGDYWIGAIVRTSATNGAVGINVMGLGTAAGMHNSGSIGVLGNAIGVSARDVFMGNGMYATAAIPSSIPFSGINNTAVSNLARANFYHAIYSATF